jgi:hypothetical protein
MKDSRKEKNQRELFTAEAPFDAAQGRLRTQSKEFLVRKYSDLCELSVSVV